ncbi:hypothetical protein QWJ34_26435 [Saccharibacillus sp. CPCC 101409]|uniref:hypothetical protein n=1 Tax=Saccharibacillus sp. CPCC 101409 TaxID=3058041 RepID=UPI002671808A|nr:hypothetical protein [Saccharibacillus sp. CPCC 101409]MDO3413318.1 hypothetical protein [Saccharibacillus sp. CPCC 101409]
MKIVGLKKLDPVIRFWRRVIQKERDWFERMENDREAVFDELSEALQSVDANLVFEVSEQLVEGKRELILSADGIFDSFDSVISLYDAAPELKYWKVIAFRPRMQSADGLVIQMIDWKLSYDDIYFSFEPHENDVDLNVHIRNYDAEDGRFSSAYFILLDTLIGEFDAVMRIGETKFQRLEESEISGLRPFVELTEVVDSLI